MADSGASTTPSDTDLGTSRGGLRGVDLASYRCWTEDGVSERGSSDASGQGARLTAVAGVLAISELLSRVLGIVRESVLAYQLGVSSAVDAYRAAFQIPDLLNYFLAGGALSIAFIPFYTRVRSEGGDDAAARFFAKLLGTLTLVSTLATALMLGAAGRGTQPPPPPPPGL